MRMTIVAVGRAKAGPERDLVQHYLKRMAQPLNLKEVEAKAAIDAKRSEGEKLLAAAPKNAVIVVLDERGKDLSSRQLADRIAGWRDDGIRDIAFLIGGADGLDGRVRENADLLLSFGRVTWPHMLMRGMLAEQIYRAQCILAGHPYHRD